MLVTLCLCLVTACGGSGHAHAGAGTSAATGPGLTPAQAQLLSSFLYLDYQAGGASVSVEFRYNSTTSVQMAGNIDFQHHEGHLLVTTVLAGAGTSVEAVDYTATRVYEQGGPTVAAELAKAGHAGQTWVSRPPDPQDRPIDKIIEILVALASPERDNPLLVQQSGARLVGATRVAGAPVDIFQYNQAITYYVDTASGLLSRFVASVSSFSGPVEVDLSAPGPRSEPPPPASTVLSEGS